MKRNNNWEDKLKPNLDKKETTIRRILNIFGFLIIIFALVALIYAMRLRQYAVAYVCIACLIIMVFSWLKLNPRLHNSVRLSTKIIPIKQDFNLATFLSIILNTKTPYGTPKMGFQMDNMFLRVPAYILKDCGCLIFFYVHNGNIIFKSRRYKKPESPEKSYDDDTIVNAFQEGLINYFCFVINEKRKPGQDEMNKLFKKLSDPGIHKT